MFRASLKNVKLTKGTSYVELCYYILSHRLDCWPSGLCRYCRFGRRDCENFILRLSRLVSRFINRGASASGLTGRVTMKTIIRYLRCCLIHPERRMFYFSGISRELLRQPRELFLIARNFGEQSLGYSVKVKPISRLVEKQFQRS